MSYILETTPTINIPSIADNPVIEELLQNYTYGANGMLYSTPMTTVLLWVIVKKQI